MALCLCGGNEIGTWQDESIDSETTESLGTQDDTFDEDEKDNVLEDQSESSLGKNVNNKPVGPPTKIYMRRDTADEEDEMSDDGLSTVSEPTPENALLNNPVKPENKLEPEFVIVVISPPKILDY